MPVSGIRVASERAQEPEVVELTRRARAGQLDAFEALVCQTQAAVTSVVSRILNGQDDVEDVVQEVYIQAYQHIGSFRGDALFSTWIHRIALNTSLKRLKQINRKSGVSLDDPDNGLADRLVSDPDLDPKAVILSHERDEYIRRAVAALSEKHRVVVILRFFEDYSCEEIARVLGCSIGTVWSRLHYACRHLRDALGWFQE
jgi:RNA polymerase sigma-70 factor (ECF subfamily)